MEMWQVIIIVLLLGVCIGVAGGITWEKKQIEDNFEEAVNQEVEARVASVKKLIEKKAYESIVGNYQSTEKPVIEEVEEGKTTVHSTDRHELEFITQAEYESFEDEDGVEYEKIDTGYSVNTQRLFDGFTDKDALNTEGQYEIPILLPFLIDSLDNATIRDGSYVYVRNYRMQTDYRVLIRNIDIAKKE